MCNTSSSRCQRRPLSRPGHSSASRINAARSISAGSKKYSEDCVATTLTAWPGRFSVSTSNGVLTAATEPVTPSRMLAIGVFPWVFFQRDQQPFGQFGPSNTFIASVERAEEGIGVRSFQRVGHHEIGGGMLARAFGDGEQLLIADADFELEFDQQTTKTPVAPNAVDQFGGARQSQP